MGLSIAVLLLKQVFLNRRLGKSMWWIPFLLSGSIFSPRPTLYTEFTHWWALATRIYKEWLMERL